MKSYRCSGCGEPKTNIKDSCPNCGDKEFEAYCSICKNKISKKEEVCDECVKILVASDPAFYNFKQLSFLTLILTILTILTIIVIIRMASKAIDTIPFVSLLIIIILLLELLFVYKIYRMGTRYGKKERFISRLNVAIISVLLLCFICVLFLSYYFIK